MFDILVIALCKFVIPSVAIVGHEMMFQIGEEQKSFRGVCHVNYVPFCLDASVSPFHFFLPFHSRHINCNYTNSFEVVVVAIS